jgi:trans-2-enoyl-CoA reductase
MQTARISKQLLNYLTEYKNYKMDDLKFYGIPLAGVSISMLKVLNPYMEFTVLFFTIISILLKIYWDYKKSQN